MLKTVVAGSRIIISAVVIVACIGALSLAMLSLAGHDSDEARRQLLPVTSNLKSCQLKISQAQLWFSHLVSGDRYINPDQIWVLLDLAKESVRKALDGRDSAGELRGHPPSDPVLRKELENLEAQISLFAQNARQWWERVKHADDRQEMKLEYTHLFNQLIELTERASLAADQAFDRVMEQHTHLHTSMVWVWLLLLAITCAGLAYVAVRHNRETQRQIELESQLRQAQKMEAVGTLAGGIAHEFNNILAAIMGYTELAQAMAREGVSVQHELAQVIKAASRARDMVMEILAFSRQGEFAVSKLDLNQVVRDSVSLLERTIPRMIEIKLDLEEDVKPVMADSGQMQRILLNLGGNAADAMPQGGVLSIKTQNVVFDRQFVERNPEVAPGAYVGLTVADTGQGIDRDKQTRIFEPFFTTKEVGKGTGLGLAMVFGAVKGHGGHITFSSQEGGGTSFQVFLPVAPAGAMGSEPAPPALEPEAKKAFSGRILLVDDETAIRELGEQVLKHEGFEVLTADSGERALEIFQEGQGGLSLVIMDLSMPGMGGFKCLAEILAIDPDAKVIIASGYITDEIVQRVKDGGAAGYVAKPFSRAELLDKLREILSEEPGPA